MALPRWAIAFGSALLLVPVAIAIGSSRRRRTLDGADDETVEEETVDAEGATAVPEGETWERERREGYRAKPTKDEGDCLILGKEHQFYKFGKYRVCLSDNQKQVLFKGKKGKKLGCGVFACAYSSPSRTKVVKFTRDAEDVAALLDAQKTGLVPKVFATYKLRDDGHAIDTDEETPVYALVVERLKPFSPEEREKLDSEIWRIADVVSGFEPTLEEFCSESSKVACETAHAAVKLKEAGIKWTDVHSGNIGLDKSGHVKVLDLGVTGTQLKKQPQILAGAQRRLAKRALRGV